MRPADVADLPVLTGWLTSAFFDDPVWGLWAFPEPTSRAAGLSRLLGFWATAAQRHGWVHLSEQARAASVWVPPGRPELTPEMERAFGPLADELMGSRRGELEELLEQFEANHPGAPEHYYLSLWGRHLGRAGSGGATALLRQDLAMIDAERAPAYLESTNPANLARYERLGFQARSHFGPAGGPVVTGMWREPR